MATRAWELAPWQSYRKEDGGSRAHKSIASNMTLMRKGHRFSASGTKIVRCCNCCWEVALSCHSPNASTSSRWFSNFFTGTFHECLIAIAGVPLNEQHKLSCAWPAWHKNLYNRWIYCSFLCSTAGCFARNAAKPRTRNTSIEDV